MQHYIRKYWHIIAGLVCVAVLGFFHINGQTGREPPQLERVPLAAADNAEETPVVENIREPVQRNDITVHIAGAVYLPGVYTLPYGSRVNDVLLLAGGATEEADLARINLAAFLSDAQQVIIPTEHDEIEAIPETAQHRQDSGLVNINTADTAQLQTLPGIGPVIAGNIIAHREANGLFDTVEQLINVPRIGAGTLNNIRDLITVN